MGKKLTIAEAVFALAQGKKIRLNTWMYYSYLELDKKTDKILDDMGYDSTVSFFEWCEKISFGKNEVEYWELHEEAKIERIYSKVTLEDFLSGKKIKNKKHKEIYWWSFYSYWYFDSKENVLYMVSDLGITPSTEENGNYFFKNIVTHLEDYILYDEWIKNNDYILYSERIKNNV